MLLHRRDPVANDEAVRARDDDVVVEHGPSLAKGPNLVVGTILLVFGLSGLLTNSDFPSTSSNFPDGNALGQPWLGLEVNGWTCFFCIAAGGLLLFGAAQHHLAKMMSLLVGLTLGACAIIAAIDGDVFGLAAANRWTELGWGIAAVVLILNVFSPRRHRERAVAPSVPAYTSQTEERETDEAPATVDRDRTVTRHDGRFVRDDEPVTTTAKHPD